MERNPFDLPDDRDMYDDGFGYDEYDDDDEVFGVGGSSEMREVRFHRIKAETDRSWLIEFAIDKNLNTVDHWIPKSRCDMAQDNHISMPMWLIEENNLEDYIEE